MKIPQPNITPVPGKDEYILNDDYFFDYGSHKIVVPSMFLYDGASIPRFGWQITYTPFHPDVMAPALVHDWLYVSHQTSRKTADKMLYDMLLSNEASKVKAKLMYSAVRIGGGGNWGYSEKDIQKLNLLYILVKHNKNFEAYHFPKEALQ